MMKKLEIYQKIKNEKIIAVIRAESGEKTIKIIDALVAGGVNIIEITFTIPYAVDVLKTVAKQYENDDVLIGAGTVLDAETARLAILNGAEYIVSPNFNKETSILCNRYCVPYFPGCMTVRECVEALESGCDVIKCFSANQFDASFVKGIKGPLPQLEIMPTGLVDLDNIYDWFDAGVLAVGVGSGLVGPAKKDDYRCITENAITYVNKIKSYKGNR